MPPIRLMLLAASAQFLAALPAAAAPAPAPAGRTTEGRTAYLHYGCWQCHNYEAQGGTSGPRLGPQPMAWAAFEAYVREPRGDMPPYRETVLPARALADIYAFLQARPGPARVTLAPPTPSGR